MKNRLSVILLVFVLFCIPASAMAETNPLVSMLTSSLGVSSDQATGGAGAIFELAKDRLSPESFASVAKAVPDMDTLLKAAPKLEGSFKAASDLAGFGGQKDKGGLTDLLASFTQLGMKEDMMMQFIPIVLKFVNSSGGETVMKLLEGVLK